MPRTVRFVSFALSLVLLSALTGCTGLPSLTEFLNPSFVDVLGTGTDVSSLPGDAPGVVVWVENRTARWARVVVSYRDGDENVRNYTTLVAPSDKTGQMLICPITEITLGSVADLDAPGARVFLAENVSAENVDSVPFIEVDPFGVLLREGVNYDCGDGLTFSVRETPGQTRSGYRTRVEIARAGN